MLEGWRPLHSKTRKLMGEMLRTVPCVRLGRREKDRLYLGKPPDYDVGVSAQHDLFDMHSRA